GVFHGEQPGGDWHDSWDGNVRTCAAARLEAADDRDARHRRLCSGAAAEPGFFRQTNARAAWRARPVDDRGYGRYRARDWQTGSALRAVSVRGSTAGVAANGHSTEERRAVHRYVQGY